MENAITQSKSCRPDRGGTVETAGGMSIGNASNTLTMRDQSTRLLPSEATGLSPRSHRNWRNGCKSALLTIRRIASICTGAFLLAGAGLLDGRRVATHWLWCDILQSRYKHLKVERDPIFIKEDKFYTTAGVTAGIDLSLALVEEDLGHAVAAEIARILVLFLRRPGGQSQYSTLLAQQEGIENARMRDLPVWVKAHLTENWMWKTLRKPLR